MSRSFFVDCAKFLNCRNILSRCININNGNETSKVRLLIHFCRRNAVDARENTCTIIYVSYGRSNGHRIESYRWWEWRMGKPELRTKTTSESCIYSRIKGANTCIHTHTRITNSDEHPTRHHWAHVATVWVHALRMSMCVRADCERTAVHPTSHTHRSWQVSLVWNVGRARRSFAPLRYNIGVHVNRYETTNEERFTRGIDYKALFLSIPHNTTWIVLSITSDCSAEISFFFLLLCESVVWNEP